MEAPSEPQEGTSPIAKLTCDQSTKYMPRIASRNSGVSLSAASAVIALAPSLTPNALSASKVPYTAVSSNARGSAGANAGTRLATCTARAAATPALDATLEIHIRAPPTNPAKGPQVAVR
jgi:hypothetical protein